MPTIVDQTSPVPRFLTYKNIDVFRVRATRFKKLSLLGKLCNQITYSVSIFFNLLKEPSNSRLLVLTDPPYLSFVMLFLAPFKRFRSHHLVFDVYPETLEAANILKSTSLLFKFWNFLLKKAYSIASSIIVIGGCMKDVVSKKCSVDTIENIIDLPIWCNDAHIKRSVGNIDFRTQWNLKNKFIVGYSGNLARFHPIETIMETVEKLSEHPDIVFVFVGEGAKKQWAQQYATEKKLTNCFFHSYVPYSQIGDLFRSFDCGLVGLNSENTGYSVPSKTLGLIAGQVPVLALVESNCEIARILEKYQCGNIVSPDDHIGLAAAIENLYTNSEKRLFFKENTIKAMQDSLSLDHTAARFYEHLTK